MNFGLAVGSSKRAGTPWLFRRWDLIGVLGLRWVFMVGLVLGLGLGGGLGLERTCWWEFLGVWGFGYWLSMRGGLGGLGVVG